MKKLITICLLMATTFSVRAQDIGFEETISYINEMFKENTITYYLGGSGFFLNGISVGKEGKVILYNRVKNNVPVPFDKSNVIIGAFNLFDISSWHHVDNRSIMYAKGLKEIGTFWNLAGPSGNRLEKAFTHLRSFCNKKSDPFAN